MEVCKNVAICGSGTFPSLHHRKEGNVLGPKLLDIFHGSYHRGYFVERRAVREAPAR